jgi:sRNA-binding carbon storage regulator CsrA
MPLCLSRRVGGKVFVGNNIVIEVSAVDKVTGSVRLRISAPGVDVKREELLDVTAHAAHLARAGHTPKLKPGPTPPPTSSPAPRHSSGAAAVSPQK